MKNSHVVPAGYTITLTAGDTPASLHRVDDRTIGALLTAAANTFGPYNVPTEWESDGGTVTVAVALRLAGSGPVTTDATTAHDMTASESGGYLRMTHASAKTATFRPEATHAMPSGGEWTIRNAGASGDLTLVAGSGVTVSAPSAGTLVLSAGMTVVVKRAAANLFEVRGQTVAA